MIILRRIIWWRHTFQWIINVDRFHLGCLTSRACGKVPLKWNSITALESFIYPVPLFSARGVWDFCMLPSYAGRSAFGFWFLRSIPTTMVIWHVRRPGVSYGTNVSFCGHSFEHPVFDCWNEATDRAVDAHVARCRLPHTFTPDNLWRELTQYKFL